MCLTLALTMIEKVQPPCVNLAARLHLLSHTYALWLMGDIKIRYLHHEVSGDNFSVKSVIGLNPVTSEFSVFC